MIISEMVDVASVFEKSRHAIFNWTEVVPPRPTLLHVRAFPSAHGFMGAHSSQSTAST